MSKITKLKFGNPSDMRQPIDTKAFGRRVREKRTELGLSQESLGKAADYSQSNVQWAESGKAKDPRILAQDFAEPLRTSAEWLLYGTGVRDVAAPPMTAEYIFQNWDSLSLQARESISAQVMSDLTDKRKKRKAR